MPVLFLSLVFRRNQEYVVLFSDGNRWAVLTVRIWGENPQSPTLFPDANLTAFAPDCVFRGYEQIPNSCLVWFLENGSSSVQTLRAMMLTPLCSLSSSFF